MKQRISLIVQPFHSKVVILCILNQLPWYQASSYIPKATVMSCPVQHHRILLLLDMFVQTQSQLHHARRREARTRELRQSKCLLPQPPPSETTDSGQKLRANNDHVLVGIVLVWVCSRRRLFATTIRTAIVLKRIHGRRSPSSTKEKESAKGQTWRG